jgi:hypothetical protein
VVVGDIVTRVSANQSIFNPAVVIGWLIGVFSGSELIDRQETGRSIG